MLCSLPLRLQVQAYNLRSLSLPEYPSSPSGFVYKPVDIGLSGAPVPSDPRYRPESHHPRLSGTDPVLRAYEETHGLPANKLLMLPATGVLL